MFLSVSSEIMMEKQIFLKILIGLKSRTGTELALKLTSHVI